MPQSDQSTFNLDVESYRLGAGITLSQLSLRTGIARTRLRRQLARPGLFLVDELYRVCRELNIPKSAIEAANEAAL